MFGIKIQVIEKSTHMGNESASSALLEVKNLTKHFPVSGGKVVHAVDDVSFAITRGKTLGLVGESGCGKSTCARTVIRIYEPTSGRIILDGSDITELSQKQLLTHRRKMQMIFQDPYASLNSRMTVQDIIAEPLRAHHICGSKAEEREMVAEMLRQVGLSQEHASRYAHEFSGGQRQRVGIARALILQPQLVICDEPISALDVSIQAQVVNMLRTFQEQRGLTYLFIAHDLSMVRYVSDDVGLSTLIRSGCLILFRYRIRSPRERKKTSVLKVICRVRSRPLQAADSIQDVRTQNSVVCRKCRNFWKVPRAIL